MARRRASSGQNARAQKRAQRAAQPAFGPCPPGQVGGFYKPLNEQELQAIVDTALRLLEELGMGDVPPRLRDDLLAAGACLKAFV